TREVVNVTDVTKDPRYMMCFPGTRSEIMVPILGSHGLLGQIDIDSDAIAAFSEEDESFLQAVAGELARALEF
ncbi:MAG: GAF domain-containing protein, partial [Thermoplasmata archaeon]